MKIGYARISTIDQNLNLQLDLLNQAGCDVIYRDEGLSGASTQRSGLDEALEHLHAGDILIVWKLDRLARSLSYLCELIEVFSERNIGFKSLTDGIDTTTTSGKLVFHIMGALAEFERDLIRERTVAGMEAARKRGVVIGRPRKLTNAQIKTAYAEITTSTSTITAKAKEFGVCRDTLSLALKKHC